jgi:single-stranded DNA-specific DHH superfamily exonuclease
MSDEDWIADFNDALWCLNKRFIVTSPDVDGLLSAALMCDQFWSEINR